MVFIQINAIILIKFLSMIALKIIVNYIINGLRDKINDLANAVIDVSKVPILKLGPWMTMIEG